MSKKVKTSGSTTDILIAEDSPTQAAQIKYLLESYHYNVVVTQNGLQALNWLSDHKPSLVISDIVMPEMNGFELCEKIKSDAHTEDIPVILLTSLSDPNEVIEGLSCGADSFITKPYNKEDLITNIEKILKENAAPVSKGDKLDLEIKYDGKKRLIRTEPQKLVRLLLNIYQEAIHQNNELIKTQDELKLLNESLEDLVEQRTEKLIVANKELLFQNEEKEKRAAELMKAREKAEESDNLKSAFLNNLSHEIRTPMNQILGFASFLKEPGLPEVTRDEYIDIIEQQSHQLLHIITDIVEVSKLAAGQVNIKTTTINLDRMMNELFVSFKPKAENRNLKLYLFKKIVDAESMVQGDQVKLRKIISNLIENAIKYTDIGSVRIEYSSIDNKLIVSVKDTGIGIDEQAKEVIFDHFRQIEITMARKYGGMGLGLSISKAYIHMMSGVIRMESELGVGSTFTIEVPYVPVVSIPEPVEGVVLPPVISRPEWQDKTLLIAEDEDSNVQLLKAVLRLTGIHLLIAVNGLEAVEQCKTHPEIDVVLMDIKMPRMSGIEATKIIKSFRSDLPIIATTAFAMIDEMEHILEAGCNDYLSKPMKREDLIAKIQKYIFSR